MINIRRRMVRAANRDVHVLVAGKGSPLLLVHGSPNNSSALRPLIEYLAQSFMVFAPDTPGNGESDPLRDGAEEPESYGTALAHLLDALGLSRVGAYGFHSGATFAAELARLYPERVSALVCDAIPLWNQSEAKLFDEGFLQSYAPSHDAAHLARLWTRLVDQNWYFPWHLRDKGREVNSDLNDTDGLHQRAMELLIAGDAYRAPYAAALRADGAERLKALRIPTLLVCDAHDVLREHMRRTPKQENLKVCRFSSREQLQRRVGKWFSEHAAPVPQWIDRQGARRFVDLPQGQVFLRSGSGADTLWIHDVGESSLAAPEGRMSFDLPGHGLTDIECPQNTQDLGTLVGKVLEALHVDPQAPGVLGAGLGYQLAGVLAGRQPSLKGAPCAVPDIAPKWDGSHLFSAWHFCRFRHQYRRWDRRAPADRLGRPLPTPDELQQQMVDLLRAGADTINRLLPYSVASLGGN